MYFKIITDYVLRDINTNTKRKRFVDSMVAISVDSVTIRQHATSVKVLNYKLCGPVKVYKADSFVKYIQNYSIDDNLRNYYDLNIDNKCS